MLRARPYYPVCDQCLDTLESVRGERCSVCGRALVSEIETCTGCRLRDYPFTSNRSLFEYRGRVKELIHQYKFAGRRRVGLVMADQIAEVLSRDYRDCPIVPVPPRPSVKRERGWDQIEWICRFLERRYKREVLRYLSRSGGEPQKALSYEQRQINMARAKVEFSGDARRLMQVPGVVLLDDIFTTGATAGECTRVLREAGASRVYVLTYAQD
jgi:ComF family protein